MRTEEGKAFVAINDEEQVAFTAVKVDGTVLLYIGSRAFSFNQTEAENLALVVNLAAAGGIQ